MTPVVYWSVLEPGGRQPTRGHADDAGWDLIVSYPASIRPGELCNVKTSIAVAIPTGWFGHLIGRSSTPRRYGVSVVSAVIDAGYRGELFVQVRNMTDGTVNIPEGVKLAQLLLHQVPAVRWIQVPHLPNSARGVNGFGSTGE